MEDLRAPTEAMSCGLTLASVPNLKTLDLNAKPILAPFDVLELFPSPGDAREVSRLIQGLAATKIRTLTLSTGLNGLRIGPAHALTHLTVDFAGPSPLVFIPKGSFTNVTILMIRCAKGEMHLAGNFRWKLEKLLTCLPTIRTLGFECSTAIENCTIPSAVEKIIIRPAEFGAVNWVRNYLGDFVPRKTALNCVELYWPDDWHAYTFWYMYQELVSRTGVKVVVWWKGYVWRVFEP
ncbi:hypothetical protein CC86DRAFT_372654 [Ophiobolus disseminans]|uniref:F-box domain-containing protein n=1 Tax=Ophiobolus disseminans TaxID=1469910 RepID=A0A6A6ZP44_9PLEO|nr:hypothetical protein CC86DRAFT_372654 [Ophiobolus disseminans]